MELANERQSMATLETIYSSLTVKRFSPKVIDSIFSYFTPDNSLDLNKFCNPITLSFFNENIFTFLKENKDSIFQFLTSERKTHLTSIFDYHSAIIQQKPKLIEENDKLFTEIKSNYNQIPKEKMTKFIDNFNKMLDLIVNDVNNEKPIENFLEVIIYTKEKNYQKDLNMILSKIYNLIGNKKFLVNRIINLVLLDKNSKSIQMDLVRENFCLNNSLTLIFDNFSKVYQQPSNLFEKHFLIFKEKFQKIRFAYENYESTNAYQLDCYFDKIKDNKEKINNLIRQIKEDNDYISNKTFYYIFLIYIFQNNPEVSNILQKGSFKIFSQLSPEIEKIDLHFFLNRKLNLGKNHAILNNFSIRILCIKLFFSKDLEFDIDCELESDDFNDNILDKKNLNYLGKIFFLFKKNNLNKTKETTSFIFNVLNKVYRFEYSKEKEFVIESIYLILDKYYEQKEFKRFHMLILKKVKQESYKFKNRHISHLIKEIKQKFFKSEFNSINTKLKEDKTLFSNLHEWSALLFLLYLIPKYKRKILEIKEDNKLLRYLRNIQGDDYQFIKEKEEKELVPFVNNLNQELNEMLKVNIFSVESMTDEHIKDYMKSLMGEVCIIETKAVELKDKIDIENDYSYFLKGIIRKESFFSKTKVYVKDMLYWWYQLGVGDMIIDIEKELNNNSIVYCLFVKKRYINIKND